MNYDSVAPEYRRVGHNELNFLSLFTLQSYDRGVDNETLTALNYPVSENPIASKYS